MISVPRPVAEAARKGLELRRIWGRGGTEIGEETAKLLSKGGKVSEEKVRHVAAYFPRHAGDKLHETDEVGRPSNGYIAWLLWGGDAGRDWSKKFLTKKNPMNWSKHIPELPFMTGGQIAKLEERLRAASSRNIDALIDAGRGNEKSSEIMKKTDPLSREYTEIAELQGWIGNEYQRRMGERRMGGSFPSGKARMKKQKNPLFTSAYNAGKQFAQAKASGRTPRYTSFAEWWKEKGAKDPAAKFFDASDAKDFWVNGMNSLKKRNPPDDNLGKVSFKAKPYKVSQPDGSIRTAIDFKAKLDKRDSDRKPHTHPYYNSDLFVGLLNRRYREVIGSKTWSYVDELPEGVSVDLSKFLGKVTVNLAKKNPSSPQKDYGLSKSIPNPLFKKPVIYNEQAIAFQLKKMGASDLESDLGSNILYQEYGTEKIPAAAYRRVLADVREKYNTLAKYSAEDEARRVSAGYLPRKKSNPKKRYLTGAAVTAKSGVQVMHKGTLVRIPFGTSGIVDTNAADRVFVNWNLNGRSLGGWTYADLLEVEKSQNPARASVNYGLSKSIPNPFTLKGFAERDEDGDDVTRKVQVTGGRIGKWYSLRKPVLEQTFDKVYEVQVPRLKPVKGKVYKFTHSGFRTLGYSTSLGAAQNAAEQWEFETLKPYRRFKQELYGAGYDPRIVTLRYSQKELANFKRLAIEKASRAFR